MADANIEQFVEKCRLVNEPTNHWEARKKFLLRNWEDYEEMQLVSLSMVWANMQFDGCRYSPELMDRVHTMASGILESDSKISKTYRKKVDFVRSEVTSTKRELDSDVEDEVEQMGGKKQCLEQLNEDTGVAACGVDVAGNKISQQQCSPVVHLLPQYHILEKSGGDDFKAFAELCKAFKVICQDTRKSPYLITSKLWELLNTHKISNKIEFKSSQDSTKCSPDWKSYLIICNAVCATHIASSKKTAKSGMLDLLVKLWKDHNVLYLCRSSMKEKEELGFKYEMVYSRESGINKPQIDQSRESNSSELPPNRYDGHKIMSVESIMESLPHEFATHELNRIISAAPKCHNFVLFENAEGDDEVSRTNPVSVLVCSASMSKVPLEFGTEDFRSRRGKKGILCNVLLCSRSIATGLAMSIREAKFLAAHNALRALRMTHSTLRKTNKNSGPAISRNELTDGAGKEETLPETNVGHKLLMMMGWKGEGAGLGKKGDGIADPVKATGTGSRSKEGLGFDMWQLKDPNTKKLDERKIYQFMQDYARSDREEELIFSSEFSLEERKRVHTMSLKLGLKSKSKGKGKNRFLTVGRKWDVSSLIKTLEEKGGSVGNYELLGPSL